VIKKGKDDLTGSSHKKMNITFTINSIVEEDPGHSEYCKKSQPGFQVAARNEIWYSISKDEGRSWSEPRFVFAGISSNGFYHSNSYIDMFADGSHINIFLGQDGKQLLYLQFEESNLKGFLTKSELAARNSK